MSPVTPGSSKSCDDDDNDGESDSGSINSDFDAQIRDCLDSLDSEQLDKFLEPLEEGEITENSDDDCDSDDSEKTVILPLERQYNRKLAPNDVPFEDKQEPPVQINTPTATANLFSRRPAAPSSNTHVTENDECLNGPNPGCSSFDPSKFIVTVPADPSPSTANHGSASSASSLPPDSEPPVDEEKTQALREKILKILNTSKLVQSTSTNTKPVALVSPQVNQENLPPPPSIGPITTPYFKSSERNDESAETAQSERVNCESSSSRNKSSDREAAVIEKPKKSSKPNKTSSEVPKIICPAVEEFSLEEEASVEKEESSCTADQKSINKDKPGFSHASEQLSAVSSASGSEPAFDSNNISEKTARDLLAIMSQCHKFFQPEEFKKLIEPQESLLRLVLEAQKNQVINLESSLVKKINMFLRYGQKSDDEGGKKKKKKKKKEKDKSKSVKSQVSIPNKEPKNQSKDVEGSSSSCISEISPRRIPARSTTLESTHHSRSRKSRSRSRSRSKSKSRSLSPRNHHSTHRKRYRSPSPKRRNHFHSRHRRSRSRSRSRSVSPFPLSKSRRRSRSRSYSRSPVRRSPPRNSRRDFYTSKRSPDRSRTSRPLRRRSLSPLSSPNRCGIRRTREELKKENEDAVKKLREVVEPLPNSNPSTSGTHEITIPLNPNASFLPTSINEFNVPSRAAVENQCASFSADVQYPYNQPFPEERPFEQPQPLYMDPALAIMHPGSQDPYQNSYIAHNPVSEPNGYSYPMHLPVQAPLMQPNSLHVPEPTIQPPPPEYPLPMPPPPPPPGMPLLVGQPLIANDPAYIPNTMYSHESVPLAALNCIPQPLLQSIPLPVASVGAPLPGSHPPQPVPAPVSQIAPQTLPSVEPLLPPSANYYDPLAPDEGSAEVKVSNNRVSFTEVHVTNSSVSFSQVHVTSNRVSFTSDPHLLNANSSTSVAGHQSGPNDARRPLVNNCDGEETVSITPNMSLSSKPKKPIKINIRQNQKQTPGVGNDADSDYVEVLELPPKPPPTIVTLDDEEDKVSGESSRVQPLSSPLVIKSVDDINKSLGSANKTAYSPKPIATIENRKRIERVSQDLAKSRVSGNTSSNPNLRIAASLPSNRDISKPLAPSTSSSIGKSKTTTAEAKQHQSESTINTKNPNTSYISEKSTGIQVSATAAPGSSSKKNQLPVKNPKPNAISTTSVSTMPNAKSTKVSNSFKQTDKKQNNQLNQAKGGLPNKQGVQSKHVDKNHLPVEKTGGDLPGCNIKGPNPTSSVKETSHSSDMSSKCQTHAHLSRGNDNSLQNKVNNSLLDSVNIDESEGTSRTDSITLHYCEEIQADDESKNLSTSAVARCIEDSPSKESTLQADVSTMNVPKNVVETNSSCVSSNVQPDKHSDGQSVDESCKKLGAQKNKVTNDVVEKSSSSINKSGLKSSQEDSSKPKSKQPSMTSRNSSDIGSSLSGKTSGQLMPKNTDTVNSVSKMSCQVSVRNSNNTNSEKSTKVNTECPKSLDNQHQNEKENEEGINRNKVTSENIATVPSKSLEKNVATSEDSASAAFMSKSSTLNSVSGKSTDTSKVKSSENVKTSKVAGDSTNSESAEASKNARFMKLQRLLSQIESVKQSVAQGIIDSPKKSDNSPLDEASKVPVSVINSDTNSKSSEPTGDKLSLPKSSENSSAQESICDNKESENTAENKGSLHESSQYSSAKESTDLSKESKEKSSSSVTSEASVVKIGSDNSKQSKILSKKKTSTSKSVKAVEPQTKAVSSDNSDTMKNSCVSKDSENSLKDKASLQKSSKDSFAQENSCLSKELKDSHKDGSSPLVSSKGSVSVERCISKELKNSQKDESSSYKSSKVCLGQENTDLSKEAKDSQKDKSCLRLSSESSVSVDSSCTGKELKDSLKDKNSFHKPSKDSVAQENTDSNKESKASYKDKSSVPVPSIGSVSAENSHASKEPKDSLKDKTSLHKSSTESPVQENFNLIEESTDSNRGKSTPPVSSGSSVVLESSDVRKEAKDSREDKTSLHKPSKSSPAQRNTDLLKESKESHKAKSSLPVSSLASSSVESSRFNKEPKDSPKDKTFAQKLVQDLPAQEVNNSRKELKYFHKTESSSVISSEGSVTIEKSCASKEPKDLHTGGTSSLSSSKTLLAQENPDLSKKSKYSQKAVKDSPAQENTDSSEESKDSQEATSSSAVPSKGLVSLENSHASKDSKDSLRNKTSSFKSFKDSHAQENTDSSKELKDSHKAKSSPRISSEDSVARESSSVKKKPKISPEDKASLHKSSKDSLAEETSNHSKGTKNCRKDNPSISYGNSVDPGSGHVNEGAKNSQDPQIRSDGSKQSKILTKNKTSDSKSTKDVERLKRTDSNEDSKSLQKANLKPSSEVTQECDSINNESESLQKDKALPQKLDKNSVPQKNTDTSKESKMLLKDKPSSSKPSKVLVDSKALTSEDRKKHPSSENFGQDRNNSTLRKIKMPPGVCINKQVEVKLERLHLYELNKRDRKFIRSCRLRAKNNHSETSKAVKKEHSSRLDSDSDDTSSSKKSKVPVKHGSFELDSDSDETPKNVIPKVSAKRQVSKLDSNLVKSSNDVTSKASVKRRFLESDSDSDESINKRASKLSVKRRLSGATVKHRISESDSDSDETEDEEGSKVSVKGLGTERDSNLDKTLNPKSSKSSPRSHSSESNYDSDAAENVQTSKVTVNSESSVTPDDEPIKPLLKRRASRIESDSDVTPGNSPIKAVSSKRRLSVLSSDSDEEPNKSSEAPLQRLIAELSSDSDDVTDRRSSKGPKRRLSETSKGSDKTDVNTCKRKKSDPVLKKEKESKKEKEEAQLKMVQEKLLQSKSKLGSFRIPKLSSKNKAPSGILKSSNEDDKRSILNDRNANTILSFERPKENVHKPVLKGLRHRLLNRTDDSSSKSVSPDPSAGSTGNLIKERRSSADNQLKENHSLNKSDKLSPKTLTDEIKTSLKSTAKENVLYPIENLKGSAKSVSHDGEPHLRESSEVSSEHISETSNGESESSESTKVSELESVKNVKGNEKSVSCVVESHSKESAEVISEIICETLNQEGESSALSKTSEHESVENLKGNEKSVSCLPHLREGSEVTSKIISGIPNRENESSGQTETSELSKKSVVNDEKSPSVIKLPPSVEMKDAVSSLAKEMVPIDSSATDAEKDKAVEGCLVDVTINEVEPSSKTDEVAPASKPRGRPSLTSRIAQQIERKKKRKLLQNQQLKKKISSLEHKNLFLQAKVVHYKHNARGFKELYLKLKKQKQKPNCRSKSVQCCVSNSGNASEIATTSMSLATANNESPQSTSQNQTSGSKNSKADEGLSYKAKRGKKLWTYLQSQNSKKTVSCQTSGPKLDCKLINTNNATIISAAEMNISYVTSALLSYKQEAALDK